MQYGNINAHNHCTPASTPANGSTTIRVPIGEVKVDCCAELKDEVKVLRDELFQAKRALNALPNLNALGAGLLSSNGATPAEIKPLSLAELALMLAPLMPEHEHDTYEFRDAFGKEILPRILPFRP
jgi:hypothetical protein